MDADTQTKPRDGGSIIEDHGPRQTRHRVLSLVGRIVSFRRVAVAVSAACGLVTLYFIWNREQMAETTRLLAQAFGERRTVDLRFPGAHYATAQRERSSRVLDPPRVWLEAELTITKALASGGSNPQWLEAGAEADLFRWNYANALDVLQRVGASKPQDARLNTDLALAYFERAEAEGRGADYSSAAEALSKAIERSPGSADLRFNRAVIYERLFLYAQSASDWEAAIHLEPNGGWAGEARSHLTEIENRKLGGDPPITPHRYLALHESGLDPELALRPATESWLQIAAFGGAKEKAESIEALQALGADLADVKHDRWLRELLRSLDDPLGRQAFAALAETIHENRVGHAADAGRLASESKTLFEKAGNRAGALQSSFEGNYAQQRALRRADCAVANASLSHAIPREFVWLGVQVWTERGVCEYNSSNPGAAWDDWSTAVSLAREGGYREPTVRPLSYQNDFRADLGDSAAAWQGNLSGLAEVWGRPHDLGSPYHFYARIFSLASRAGDWNTALAVKREAIVNVAATGNLSLLAVNHYQAGTVALSAGDHAAADDEFKRAQEIFQRLPLDAQIRAYLFACELGKAEAEMRAGNPRLAETSFVKSPPSWVLSATPQFNCATRVFLAR